MTSGHIMHNLYCSEFNMGACHNFLFKLVLHIQYDYFQLKQY
jgi:hypothetical protein